MPLSYEVCFRVKSADTFVFVYGIAVFVTFFTKITLQGTMSLLLFIVIVLKLPVSHCYARSSNLASVMEESGRCWWTASAFTT